ncbi:transcriptional regulator [Rhodoplanes elegans]|uniref:Transcriptional regulator n=1 Tax=Rhodoplanes elegans TaxID=29408 RepID=A0A327KUQ0_9BRAD|nr:helix-turn-helix domain-containing protein [Rhodoplanes elegans]MBK5960599.1 transcriptional regulator [Rhodoplanes elegans]RAI41443.1 transcriptional regulator [Rhodoplanes elegans]
MLMQNAQTLSPTHPAKPADRWSAEQGNGGAPGLDALGVRMAFARNAEIFGEGEPTTYVYKVVSGAARTYKVLDDGRRQISSFYLPGEVFGLEATAAHHCSAEAVTRSVLLVIKRSALVSLAEAEHRVSHMLWALTARELQQVRTHMLVLIRSAQERVACFLLELAERMGVTDQIELPMSRQDIADYLGLTIETISRTLTQLESTGAIAVPTCRRIVLRDRKALKRLHA